MNTIENSLSPTFADDTIFAMDGLNATNSTAAHSPLTAQIQNLESPFTPLDPQYTSNSKTMVAPASSAQLSSHSVLTENLPVSRSARLAEPSQTQRRMQRHFPTTNMRNIHAVVSAHNNEADKLSALRKETPRANHSLHHSKELHRVQTRVYCLEKQIHMLASQRRS